MYRMVDEICFPSALIDLDYRYCEVFARLLPHCELDLKAFKLYNFYFYLDSNVSLLLIIIYIIERISSIWVFKITITCVKIIVTCSWLTRSYALFFVNLMNHLHLYISLLLQNKVRPTSCEMTQCFDLKKKPH